METCGQDARAALGVCDDLLKLLAHMQQHRGMASAWLAGDQSFQSRLISKQREILPLFAVLTDVADRETVQAIPCFTDQQFALFRADWQALITNLENQSSDQSVAQHTLMIEQLLVWLAAFGEARIENSADKDLPSGLVRRFCHHLPALTEVLGQARASGVSVAARGACTPVAKVRLMFLTARIETLLQQSLTVEDGGQLPGAEARPSVHALVQVIRRELLAGTAITIRADQYFSLATKAIDAVFVWIDECDKTLRDSLSSMPGSRQWSGVVADLLSAEQLRERQA